MWNLFDVPVSVRGAADEQKMLEQVEQMTSPARSATAAEGVAAAAAVAATSDAGALLVGLDAARAASSGSVPTDERGAPKTPAAAEDSSEESYRELWRKQNPVKAQQKWSPKKRNKEARRAKPQAKHEGARLKKEERATSGCGYQGRARLGHFRVRV